MVRRGLRWGALVLALTFFGVAAAACGGSDDASSAKTPAATSQAAASTPSAVATRTPTPERPPPTPTNQQILSNGKQQNMYEWVKSISSTPAQDESRSFHIVQSGSTLKMASCETLKQWAKE